MLSESSLSSDPEPERRREPTADGEPAAAGGTTANIPDADPPDENPLGPGPAPPAATESSLSPAWIPAEMFAYRILDAILGLAAGGVVAWGAGFGLTGLGLGLGVALLVYQATTMGARALVARHYRHCTWAVDADHFRLRKGILWRKEIHVPRSRLQHTDVTQGPVQRKYGVATLVLHTAGTSYATISVEGLDADVARSLRDRLLVGGADDGV